MSTWDEIKKLAADFQRTQTSDALQRISDRNCIDIIKKLTDLNLIQLIYTCDGKEFITPECLIQEMQNEVSYKGGRMHLHELSSELNIDYQHVEDKAKDLVKLYPEQYFLVLGQLIHIDYQNLLTKHVRDKLLSTGELSLAEVAKNLDLPSEFLSSMITSVLKKVCDDYVLGPDGKTYYTTELMDRYKGMIAGTLAAITKPTSIASILKRIEVPEKIFNSLLDSLTKSGRIDARIENRQIIPSIYTQKQNEFIDRFYAQNSYIEYGVVMRLDIKQPKAFLKKRFTGCIFLTSSCISPSLLDQTELMIEEIVANSSWIDISTILPSCLEEADVSQINLEIFKRNKKLKSSCKVFNIIHICSLGFIEACRLALLSKMEQKAQDDLKDGTLVQFFIGSQPKHDQKPKSNRQIEDPEQKDSESRDSEIDASMTQNIPKPGASLVEQDRHNQNTINIEESKRKSDKKVHIDNEQDDSDFEHSHRKSKSRKSGGGTQGREVKQKSVKKKYIPGNKGNNKNEEDADETKNAKNRSNKGRASRRGLSPEAIKSEDKTLMAKKILTFMDDRKLVDELKKEQLQSDDCNEELLAQIVSVFKDNLNEEYVNVARKTFDEFLKQQDDKKNTFDDQIEVVE